MQFIKEDEYNRWQDHALIKTRTTFKNTPFRAVTSPKLLKEIIQSNSNCLIAGFGLQEQASWGTGFLSGSRYKSNVILNDNRILLSQRRYKFELLPGDSGGPLLCHYKNSWYDLGTASAHDWDHNSIYAPNTEVRDWMETFALEKERLHLAGLPQTPKSSTEIEVGQKYYLKTYSRVIQDGTNKDFYNGDNRYTTIKVDRLEGDKAFGEIESFGSSQFFLCEEKFLCYGLTLKGIVEINKIHGTKIIPKNKKYDPFQ